MSPKIITLSYDGGGWTHPYAAGFTKYVQINKHKFPRNTQFRYAGISAGSCVGLAAALDIPMDTLFHESLKWSRWCRYCPLLTTRAVRAICNTLVKDDAHAQSLTNFAVNTTTFRFDRRRLKPTTNVIDRFDDKKHLADIMVGTCSLPLLNHLPLPFFTSRPQHYDGGFSGRFFTPPWLASSNMPTQSKDEQPHHMHIKISPWRHRKDATHTPSFNIPWYRLIFPYNTQGLKYLYERGYEEAAVFFEPYLSDVDD